jgi:hypothetical protein
MLAQSGSSRQTVRTPDPSTEAHRRTLRGDRCRCSRCGELFRNTGGFDRHRYGKYAAEPPQYGRRCRTPAELLAAGWKRNADGFWMRPGSADPHVTYRQSSGDRHEGLHRHRVESLEPRRQRARA